MRESCTSGSVGGGVDRSTPLLDPYSERTPEGYGSRTNGGSWRTIKTRSRELGRPRPIRKQGSCNSGYRGVADPRYQSYDFVRLRTIFCDRLHHLIALGVLKSRCFTPPRQVVE